MNRWISERFYVYLNDTDTPWGGGIVVSLSLSWDQCFHGGCWVLYWFGSILFPSGSLWTPKSLVFEFFSKNQEFVQVSLQDWNKPSFCALGWEFINLVWPLSLLQPIITLETAQNHTCHLIPVLHKAYMLSHRVSTDKQPGGGGSKRFCDLLNVGTLVWAAEF